MKPVSWSFKALSGIDAASLEQRVERASAEPLSTLFTIAGNPEEERAMLSPHPYQMALMGFWFSESQKTDLLDYAKELETYATKLEQELDKMREENEELRRQLSKALREKDEIRRAFEIYTKIQSVKKERPNRETLSDAAPPNSPTDTPLPKGLEWIEKRRRFREDMERMFRFLSKFFGADQNPFLTSRGMAYREKILLFVRHLSKQMNEIL